MVVNDAPSLCRSGLSVFAIDFALRADIRYRTHDGEILAATGDPWLLMVSSIVVETNRASMSGRLNLHDILAMRVESPTSIPARIILDDLGVSTGALMSTP